MRLIGRLLRGRNSVPEDFGSMQLELLRVLPVALTLPKGIDGKALTLHEAKSSLNSAAWTLACMDICIDG